MRRPFSGRSLDTLIPFFLRDSAIASRTLCCAFANRRYSPDRFWVQWVALAWGGLFLAHLWWFSRGTLATMGRSRR